MVFLWYQAVNAGGRSSRATMYVVSWLPVSAVSSAFVPPNTLLVTKSTTVATGVDVVGAHKCRSVALLLGNAPSAAPSIGSIKAALMIVQQTRVALRVFTCDTLSIDRRSSASGAADGMIWGFSRVQRLEKPSEPAIVTDLSGRWAASLATALTAFKIGKSVETELALSLIHI